MKTWPIVYDPQAIEDLDGIHEWISRQASTRTADLYEERIVACIARLRHFPDRGSRRDDVAEGLRVLGFERRVDIAYRLTAERVEILRIMYAGRQLSSL